MPGPKTVLVVDDSDAEREIVALTLGAAFPGVEVRLAAHPQIAREMCGQEGFDCVILDYNMPQTDGVTLAGELKASSAYLPIILMTSVGDEMLAAEALRSGISDYIPKSRITAESIRRTVDRSIHVCGQARLIDEQRGELENFAYALAHDFKQPIRQITTFTQMIAEEVEPEQREGLRQHLTFLGDAARRLGKLVDVMSQYTLLNQPPELADVDLGEVMSSVRGSLGPYLEERGGELIAPAKPPMVRGNETLMTQVIQNLVNNGLLYNQSRTPKVELSVQRRGDHWDISIADNGVGIEPEYLADIFKPLVRLHTGSEYPGSGLGLTLARKAVLAQNGLIWCESELGRGSVFHVRLPAVAKARAKVGKARTVVNRRAA
jgi:signal transduction histidine kinase